MQDLIVSSCHACKQWCGPNVSCARDGQDNVYADCDGVAGWEASKVLVKVSVEAYGCAGAAQAMPALVLVAAAVTKALTHDERQSLT